MKRKHQLQKASGLYCTLLGIINDLKQIINSNNDNVIINRINDIIIKMNFIVNENKKLIMNQFSELDNKLNQNIKINILIYNPIIQSLELTRIEM